MRPTPERAFGEAAEIIDTFRFSEDGVAVIRLLAMAEGHSLVTVFVTITTDGVEAPGRPIKDTEDVEGILLPSDEVIPDNGVAWVISNTVGADDADGIQSSFDVVILDTGVTGIISSTVGLEGPFDREADPAKLEDRGGHVTSDARLAFCLNFSILSPGLIAKTMPSWQ